MKRAIAVSALLWFAGCLALKSHDGAWPCTTDADCTGGKLCVATFHGRLCVDPTTCVGNECCPAAADLQCSDGCTDVSSDPANCGRCGSVCAAGTSCVDGSCVCPTSTETLCGNACVDTQDDPANCGSCGHACTSGTTCVVGSCVSASGQNDAGGGNDGGGDGGSSACPSGDTSCSGTCRDLTNDSSNCGACGHACSAQQTCQQGSCVCPTGQMDCGSGCTDVLSSMTNCGACGAACTATGASCVGGHCSCTTAGTICNGACTNVQSDDNNCGACGSVCSGTGRQCYSGVCQCGIAFLQCGTACVDDKSDPNNCGGCGVVCPSGICGAYNCITTFATGPAGAAALASDTSNLYWVTSSGGTVMQVATTGGTPITLASKQGNPQYLAVYGGNVYWTNTSTGEVMTVPVGGGTPPTALATGQSSPSFIAVAQRGVFWLSTVSASSTTLSTVALTGGNPQVLSTGSGYSGLAVDATYEYLCGPTGKAAPNNYGELALSGTTTTIINEFAATSCTAFVLASPTSYFGEGENLYSGTALSGGGHEFSLVAQDTSSTIEAFALDSGNFYFTDGAGNVVEFVPGASKNLATGQGISLGIAVDSTSVYWTTASGAILKAKK